MRENDFAENERVLIALENDDIAGFCTFANKDELPQKYDFTPFISFMFVDEKYRGHRLSGKLIDVACSIAKNQNFSTIYVMSGEVEIEYGKERYVLNAGDSIFYDSIVEHHVHGADGKSAQILAVVYIPF
jgi:GNAT superfamily N-acetyltransferase